MRTFPGFVGYRVIIPPEPVATTARQQDTLNFLMNHRELLTIRRLALTYDGSGKVVNTGWALVSTFFGDWQPVSGSTIRAEAALKHKSESKVIAVSSVARANDRIERVDGSFMYVNYINTYEGHVTIFLKRTEGSD